MGDHRSVFRGGDYSAIRVFAVRRPIKHAHRANRLGCSCCSGNVIGLFTFFMGVDFSKIVHVFPHQPPNLIVPSHLSREQDPARPAADGWARLPNGNRIRGRRK